MNRGDTDGVVSLFTSDAVVIHVVPSGGAPRVLVGREQIRWWVQSLIAQHAAVVLNAEPSVAGQSVVWQSDVAMDSLRQLGIDAVPVASEAQIQDGALSSLSMLPTPDGARRFSKGSVKCGPEGITCVDVLISMHVQV